MTSNFLPPVPHSLKPIAHYLKTAEEHDDRDPVVAYWSRLHALQSGLKLSSKGPDETKLLVAIMEWLEKTKTANVENESISNEFVAQAYLENYALKLFNYADQQDRASNFGKNVVKAFYTAGILYDVLLTFGELSEENQANRKYCKWKAAYIHNCLKSGQTPAPGPLMNDGNNDNENHEVNSNSPKNLEVDQLGLLPSGNLQDKYSTDQIDEYKANDPAPTNSEDFRSLISGDGYHAQSTETDIIAKESDSSSLTPEQITKAQKYCKWAGSALNYDDITSAIESLNKALHLLKTGQEL